MRLDRSVAPLAVAFVVLVILAGCAQRAQQDTGQVTIAAFPIEDITALVDTTNVAFDPDVSSDGNGSFRVTSEDPLTVTVYQLGDLDLESVQLSYEAKVRCEDVEGQVFIEMICVLPGRGEFFSRALQSALAGTVDWSLQTTPFFLSEGENPSSIKLNLVINGSGTVWIDDIRVTGAPFVRS